MPSVPAVGFEVLVSVLLPRPVLFYVTRQFALGQFDDRGKVDALWSEAVVHVQLSNGGANGV